MADNPAAGHRILSVQAARRACKNSATYLLWVSEHQAVQFREPGWEPLMPPRGGAVLFLHRERERLASPKAQGPVCGAEDKATRS